MKIAVAQMKSFGGEFPKNIEKHQEFIQIAVEKHADMIVFPELSLTGYEPALAEKLAIRADDQRLDVFQKISDEKNITILPGLPTVHNSGYRISMMFFQPKKPRQLYSKRFLHKDEFPFFENGRKSFYLKSKGKIIAPAICYESLVPDHSEKAFKHHTDLYLASAAKSREGIEKAYNHYPSIAKKYLMTIVFSNSVGFCDNFYAAGKSAVWDNKGTLLASLGDNDEGLLFYSNGENKVYSICITSDND